MTGDRDHRAHKGRSNSRDSDGLPRAQLRLTQILRRTTERLELMALLIQLVVAAVSAAALAPVLRMRRSWEAAVRRSVTTSLAAAVVVTLIVAFGASDHLLYTAKRLPYVYKYTVVYLAVWIPLALWSLALGGILRLRRDPEGLVWWKRVLWAVGSALVYAVAGLLGFGTRWVSTYFGEVDADEVVFTLTTGRTNSTSEVTSQVINYVVAPTVCAAAIGLVIGLWDMRLVLRSATGRDRVMPAKAVRRVAAVTGVLAVAATGTWFTRALPVKEILFPAAPSTFIEDNYVDPGSVQLSWPTQKRNLIQIFLESYENTFYSTVQGGGMPVDLMPDLAELTEESISFSNTELKGGFHQLPGATFTVGGLLAQTSGVALKSPVLATDIQQFNFPDFATVGDLLKEQGYTNEIMMAANADFGAKRDLFQDHGAFKIFDHVYATQNGYLPEDYSVWWGYEDDKMYEFAKQELTQLAAQGDPFYFILENADTHFPDGYLSEEVTERPHAEQLSNVVLHSQQQVTALVRWIQEQPFYDNTTIVITGDHLYMDDSYFERVGVSADYDRTVVNLIVNPAPGVTAEGPVTNRSFTSVDIFPTTLAAMGVGIKGDRLGLGTNMFSLSQTLAEELGVDTLSERLNDSSEFYNAHIKVKIVPSADEAQGTITG